MKRLPDPVQKVNACVVGLDVHQNQSTWVMLDRQGKVLEEGAIPSRPERLEELYRRVVGRKKVHFAFEAGGSSLWVFDVLERLLKGDERIHVAHPKSVKAIANSTQKNDRNDAWWLAYLTYEGRLPEVWLPRARYRELRYATRERTALVQERTGTAKRIRAHLRQAGRTLPQGALSRATHRALVRSWLPELDRIPRLAIEESLEHWELLTRRIERWEKVIEELAGEWDEVVLLEKVLPGVGATLASCIVAESGPLHRFRNAKAYGRYTGLTPSERSSAGRTRFGRISREGNARLRWALTQAVTSCLRCQYGPGRSVGNWVRRREKRLGSRKKAKVAAARKFGEAVWRLFALGECFEIQRIFGCPPREAGQGA